MNLTVEQQSAVDAVKGWYQHFGLKTHFRMGGLAGCGKTFLIPHIVQELGLTAHEVAFCAYTGKAAMVMRRKGLPASTIHRLIYIPHQTIDPQTGEEIVKFERIGKLATNIHLIIVDEASMVTSEIHMDLLSYGVPILYIGDYFQLPPVSGNFSLMKEESLDAKLNTVHRQAAQSPIIRLSTDIRRGKTIPFTSGNQFARIKASELNDSSLKNADQIICGHNAVRDVMNGYMRDLLGYSGFPKRNERLVVLRNNYKMGVVNGQQLLLVEDSTRKRSDLLVSYIDAYDTRDAVSMLLGELLSNPFSAKMFAQDPKKRKVKEGDYRRVYADYAYVITCHKAQGSEWKNVVLYDDRFACRKPYLRARWLYTAVTRASEKLIWAVE